MRRSKTKGHLLYCSLVICKGAVCPFLPQLKTLRILVNLQFATSSGYRESTGSVVLCFFIGHARRVRVRVHILAHDAAPLAADMTAAAAVPIWHGAALG